MGWPMTVALTGADSMGGVVVGPVVAVELVPGLAAEPQAAGITTATPMTVIVGMETIVRDPRRRTRSVWSSARLLRIIQRGDIGHPSAPLCQCLVRR
jgi:hypothetical protein